MFEFLAELVFELVCGALGAWWQGERGLAGVLLLGLVGLVSGMASVWVFPEPVLQSFSLSALNVVAMPFAAGALVAGFQKAIPWRGPFAFDLGRFAAGFTAVLALGLARFMGLLATGALS